MKAPPSVFFPTEAKELPIDVHKNGTKGLYSVVKKINDGTSIPGPGDYFPAGQNTDFSAGQGTNKSSGRKGFPSTGQKAVGKHTGPLGKGLAFSFGGKNVVASRLLESIGERSARIVQKRTPKGIFAVDGFAVDRTEQKMRDLKKEENKENNAEHNKENLPAFMRPTSASKGKAGIMGEGKTTEEIIKYSCY